MKLTKDQKSEINEQKLQKNMKSNFFSGFSLHDVSSDLNEAILFQRSRIRPTLT